VKRQDVICTPIAVREFGRVGPLGSSSFYAGYNGMLGRKQRYWARLLYALTEAHQQDQAVHDWATALYALYARGQKCTRQELRPRQHERAYTACYSLLHSGLPRL
jgi:hypothetical protein